MNVRTSSLIAKIILGALGLTTTVAMALDNTFPRHKGIKTPSRRNRIHSEDTIIRMALRQDRIRRAGWIIRTAYLAVRIRRAGCIAGPPSPRLGRREVGAWLPAFSGRW
jgi:hypothetical protein